MPSNLIIPLYIDPAGRMLKRTKFSEYYSANSKVNIKRGTTYQIQVYFVESDHQTLYLLPQGSRVRITLRREGIFDSNAGVLVSAESINEPDTDEPYEITLTLLTEEIDSYLNVDTNSANDVVSRNVEFGVSWTEDDWATKQENTDRVLGLLLNDVSKDANGGTELLAPTAESFLSDRAVRFDIVQSLSEGEKQQARDNIGAGTGGGGEFLPLTGGTLADGAAITLDNGSKLREGSTDAGNGGYGGIALECAVGYELKWEAGRLYVRDGNNDIRVEQYALGAPSIEDDSDLGYKVGSLRILDNGTVYSCADNTQGQAVWVDVTAINIKSRLDSHIGLAWRMNTIVDPYEYGNTADPNNYVVYDYESTVTVELNDSPSNTQVILEYAGQYDGYHSYTVGGVAIPNNVDPAIQPNYQVIYYDTVNGWWVLRVNAIGSFGARMFKMDTQYQTVGEMMGSPGGWVETNTLMTYEVAATVAPSTPYVPAQTNLELYQPDTNGTQSNFYLSRIVEGVGTQWLEVVGKNGDCGTPTSISLTNASNLNLSSLSAVTGTLPYSRGGTNTSTQQAAIANLSEWVIGVTSNRLVDITDKGSTLVVNAVGTVTITIQANMGEHFNFKVMRRGTGDVIIAGQAGVTLLSLNSHTKISNQYDIVTVTRVQANVFVLSGNLKAL